MVGAVMPLTLCPCLTEQSDYPEQNDCAEKRYEEREPPSATRDVDAQPVEQKATDEAADDADDDVLNGQPPWVGP